MNLCFCFLRFSPDFKSYALKVRFYGAISFNQRIMLTHNQAFVKLSEPALDFASVIMSSLCFLILLAPCYAAPEKAPFGSYDFLPVCWQNEATTSTSCLIIPQQKTCYADMRVPEM